MLVWLRKLNSFLFYCISSNKDSFFLWFVLVNDNNAAVCNSKMNLDLPVNMSMCLCACRALSSWPQRFKRSSP